MKEEKEVASIEQITPHIAPLVGWVFVGVLGVVMGILGFVLFAEQTATSPVWAYGLLLFAAVVVIYYGIKGVIRTNAKHVQHARAYILSHPNEQLGTFSLPQPLWMRYVDEMASAGKIVGIAVGVILALIVGAVYAFESEDFWEDLPQALLLVVGVGGGFYVPYRFLYQRYIRKLRQKENVHVVFHEKAILVGNLLISLGLWSNTLVGIRRDVTEECAWLIFSIRTETGEGNVTNEKRIPVPPDALEVGDTLFRAYSNVVQPLV